MTLTNSNRAGHRVLRVVSGFLRFVLPIVIGVALLLAWTRFVFGAAPAVRTGGQVPVGYIEVDGEGWTMTVPASWESAPVFRPDSPSTVAYLFASPHAAPISGPEEFPRYRARDAYLKLGVSRQSRRDFDLDTVVALRDSCYACPPDLRASYLRRDRRVVNVHGRPGVLSDVVRADGSREWTLTVQNDCDIYAAHVKVLPSRVADMSETVEQVLASAAIKDGRKLFGRCW